MFDRKKRGWDRILISLSQSLNLREIHHRISIETRQIILVRKLVRNKRLLDFAGEMDLLPIFILRIAADADENISGKPFWLHIQIDFLRPHVRVTNYRAFELDRKKHTSELQSQFHLL